jgi:integrase
MSLLARFEENPEGWEESLKGDTEAVHLDDALIVAFTAYNLTDRGNSAQWIGKKRSALLFWKSKLEGADLRRVKLRQLHEALEGATSRRHRVEAIKCLYAWLRYTGRVESSQDPSTDLHNPPIRPAQLNKSKVIPEAHHREVMKFMRQPWRDCLAILHGTGIHVTELARFMREGVVEPAPRGRKDGAVAIMVIPRHKNGSPHRVALGHTLAEAAHRVREHGGFSRGNFGKAIREACRDADIPLIMPASYRHTLSTRAIEKGAAPAAVSAFLGHRTLTTTLRFYATHACPPRIAV